MYRQYPKLIGLDALFEGSRPDMQPVCHDGERFVCWSEFSGRVAGLARLLQQREEKRWLLASDDSLQFCVNLFALLHAGKHVVIPPNAQPGTLQALAGAFDAQVGDTLVHATPPAFAAPAALTAIVRQQAIIDLYTSGSTGQHKRIRKTLEQFDAEVRMLESLWGERLGRAAILATVPHQHIYGLLFRLFWPLAAGRVFDAVTCAHPDTVEERLALLGAAALVSSPAHLTRLPELLPLASLNPKPVAVFSSGGPLPAATVRELEKGLGQPPIEIFGSTETGGVAWRQRGSDSDSDLWTPFPCHAVSRSSLGALTLRSPFLQDDATWEMDDGIELMPDGRFRLLGRLDRVVKIEEKRLSLPEMESRLDEHAWIDAAAVVALAGRRQSIGAVLVLNGEGKAQLAAKGRRGVALALRKHLSRYFEAVLLPRHWRFPDRLPANDRGKVSHGALADLFAGPDDGAWLPEIAGMQFEDSEKRRLELDLLIRPEVEHFSGHFPGAPILPGVVQVDWAIRLARKYLHIEGEFSAVENLKFLAIIKPDTRIRLSLKWDAERKSLDFAYWTTQRKYSAGRVLFGGAQ